MTQILAGRAGAGRQRGRCCRGGGGSPGSALKRRLDRGEALNILEGFELAELDRVQALHLYLETSALAFADRNQYLADADFVAVPLPGLLSDSFAAERRALIGPVTGVPYPSGDPTTSSRARRTRQRTESESGHAAA